MIRPPQRRGTVGRDCAAAPNIGWQSESSARMFVLLIMLAWLVLSESAEAETPQERAVQVGARTLTLPFDTSPLPRGFRESYGFHGYTGPNGQPHGGKDWLMEMEQPVRAADDGVVVLVRDGMGITADYSYGNEVRIAHSSGLLTIYAHLKSGGILVRREQPVQRGDVIALSGNSGWSSPSGTPHLHFEVTVDADLRYGTPKGSPVDPYAGLWTDDPPIGAREYKARQARVASPRGDFDLSGRWAGEAVDLNSSKRLDDRVTIVQTRDKIYQVHRRHHPASGNYIVTAYDFPVGGYEGEWHGAGGPFDPQYVIEQRGSWITPVYCRKTVLEDGDKIVLESRYENGDHLLSAWHRVAKLATLPRIGEIAHEFRGLVRLGEEVVAGQLNMPLGVKYLLLVLNYPGSRLELLVVRPDGSTIMSDAPGVTYLADEIPARLYVRDPEPGQWSFRVRGVEVEADAEPFWLIATYTDEGPPGSVPSLSGGGPSLGDDQLLFALLVAIAGLGLMCAIVAVRRRGAGRAIPRRPASWLSIHPRSARASTFAVSAPVTRIGRAPGNHIVLADPKASGHHAEIRLAGGRFFLVDLGSTNGTWVNGRRAARTALGDGDRIEVGDTSLVFRTRAGSSRS